MVKFQRLIIMAVILLGFNFKANAELVVESNGRVRVSTGGFNQNGVRTWRYLDNGRGGMGGNMFYHETSSKLLAVREASTGLRSASTVPVTIEANVSRQRVLSGAFGLVKRGAALGTRLSGWGTAAYFAYEAYQAVKGDLESEGYIADESGTFLKTYDDALCILNWQGDKKVYSNCIPLDSSLVLAYEKGGQSRREAEFLLKSRTEREARKYFEQLKSRDHWYDGYIFKQCSIGSISANCSVDKNGDQRTPILFERLKNRQSEVLTPEKFLEIATPAIDRNPTPFVEGAGRPDYREDVQVSPGTVVTIGPVTGSDGRPIQIQITFARDSNGKTTATVNTTPRPDLTPGSPAAPKTNPTPTPGENGKPGGQPNPNPDGSPGSQPDPTPDGSPSDKTKPDPDDSPSDKDKPKSDDKQGPDGKDDPKPDDKPKEDEKPKESGGLLCEVFPNILACDKMGKPEEGMFDSIKIPHVTDETTWNTDNFLPPNGVCPQPKTFNIWGRPVQISYEPLCVFMQNIRFAVLLGFIITSAFIVFGSLRKG